MSNAEPEGCTGCTSEGLGKRETSFLKEPSNWHVTGYTERKKRGNNSRANWTFRGEPDKRHLGSRRCDSRESLKETRASSPKQEALTNHEVRAQEPKRNNATAAVKGKKKGGHIGALNN